MPSTRPDIRMDEQGVCSACRAYERRPTVDWSARAADFQRLMAEQRGLYIPHPVYDCVVASSGGKDSHFIAIKALELGYHPLVVTASTDFPTALGRRNIENLKNLGLDTLEFTPNPVVRKKLNRIGLEEVGDIEWPEHAAIFGLPVRIAQDMGIGIVLYGENPQSEYSGGPQDAILLDRRWREEFGGLLGLRPKDLIGREGLTAADLWPYEYPLDSSLPVHGLFLGQFYEWHGMKNALIAQAHGFEAYPHVVEGNLVNFENLDNADVGLHDYFGFLKYGFGRATVMCSLYVRRGMLTRDEAVMLARRLDGHRPMSYLGVSLVSILRDIGLDWDRYLAIEDRFANGTILEKSDDEWKLRELIA